MIAALSCLATMAVAAATPATATETGLERARARGELVAGIKYPVPEYKGGMKFRTAEAIDTELLQDLAQRLQLRVSMVKAEPAKAETALASGKADVVLATVPEGVVLPASITAIPAGYIARPMAIMRSDTDIKSWQQLKGRKVCTSEGGLYVGMLAAKYGAVEQLVRAPADSLLALRIGGCDAAVHDSAMLEELTRLPEWKKFSARLTPGPASTLAFLVPVADKATTAMLKRVSNEWSSSQFPEQLTKKRVRHIAFEVYLDQDVPDCH
ncbi:ABC transporter substrate-binding protein [Noviherbaspirillum saxi]|uniref:ABC transporter substrate-binding protein n=2 Tax=Noviherbaspirillum saxi TaxID=2320863 RepID=A0A3A3FNC4_9BURK|nr:ABC transporter substrate-binding protein [Noviherbaspirillum saxi]